jgi:hypothetical protein
MDHLPFIQKMKKIESFALKCHESTEIQFSYLFKMSELCILSFQIVPRNAVFLEESSLLHFDIVALMSSNADIIFLFIIYLCTLMKANQPQHWFIKREF